MPAPCAQMKTVALLPQRNSSWGKDQGGHFVTGKVHGPHESTQATDY